MVLAYQVNILDWTMIIDIRADLVKELLVYGARDIMT